MDPSAPQRLNWLVPITLCMIVLSLIAVACSPRSTIFHAPPPLSAYACGKAGQSCCKPPIAVPASLAPIVACKSGLGCDVANDVCVQPCGNAGQVCCDGPETRAPKWTADGKLYSPNWYGMQEMCNGGACDQASHRCFSCGTRDGEACCPPDAAQATARCFGRNMACEFSNDRATAGTCRLCGARFKPPCEDGCDPGFKVLDGLCDICGAEGQRPCDKIGCDRGLSTVRGICRQCGAIGQIPCDRGCNPGAVAVNGVCVACGAAGQPPCANGCNYGFTPINGLCRACGADGQPPCDKRCNYPLKLANGICRQCGAQGQIPCDSVCNQLLVPINGVCAPQQGPSPQQCALLNEACVPDTQPQGAHCCHQGGTPLLCVWQKCRACVPHGETCQLGGTQICCNHGDACVLDTATGNAVCDLPDVPEP